MEAPNKQFTGTLTLPLDGGPIECPVDGCGCSNVHLRHSVYQDRAGDECLAIGFWCEWGHDVELHLTEYHGQTMYTARVSEDYGEQEDQS